MLFNVYISAGALHVVRIVRFDCFAKSVDLRKQVPLQKAVGGLAFDDTMVTLNTYTSLLHPRRAAS